MSEDMSIPIEEFDRVAELAKATTKIAELEKEIASYRSGGYHHWLKCSTEDKEKIAQLEMGIRELTDKLAGTINTKVLADKITRLEKSLAESQGREAGLREFIKKEMDHSCEIEGAE